MATAKDFKFCNLIGHVNY